MAKGLIKLPVEIKFYPERLTNRRVSGSSSGRLAKDRKTGADMLVARGVRGQLRTGNLLTGQLYIALDFFPDVAKAKVNWTTTPPEFPTTPGALEDLKGSIFSVAKKLDKIDYDGISTDLKSTLASTTKMMATLDASVGQLTPEAKAVIADARRALVATEQAVAPGSPLLQDSSAMMSEIARAARAFRLLADYLEQHPEALISGKKEESK
jgi:paraquat-inducible protein B